VEHGLYAQLSSSEAVTVKHTAALDAR